MKLCQNNHLMGTWCYWKISLIEMKLWMLYHFQFLRVSNFFWLRVYFFIILQTLHDGRKDTSGPRVIVGICAMAKKTMSKPMKEILSRLNEFEYIETIIFPEDIIVNVRKNKTHCMLFLCCHLQAVVCNWDAMLTT